MFGVVSEMTPAGRRPVEGVSLYLLSCALANCPDPLIVVQETTTDIYGAYRLSGLYNGELNFLWVSKEGYVAGGPLPADSCDRCDRIVTVSGDTQLDLEVVRR
jgi:hypothetical protein